MLIWLENLLPTSVHEGQRETEGEYRSDNATRLKTQNCISRPATFEPIPHVGNLMKKNSSNISSSCSDHGIQRYTTLHYGKTAKHNEHNVIHIVNMHNLITKKAHVVILSIEP